MDKESTTPLPLSETACSVCQRHFSDPVILDCGHNFCSSCLAKYQESCGRIFCPLCKAPQPSSKPKVKLGTVAELSKKLSEHVKLTPDEICRKHQLPLAFFCKRDIALLCSKCVESMESPTVVGVAEAAREYKDKFVQYANIIKEEKEEIMAHKSAAEAESQDLLDTMEISRQTMISIFRELHQFLEEREKMMLAQLEEMRLTTERRRDEHTARLFERVTYLDGVLKEMEKCCPNPNELLKDVGSILEKFGKPFESPAVFLLGMHWAAYIWDDSTFLLDTAIEKLKSTVVDRLPLQEAIVTLDPEMGDPDFSLSEDLKSLRQASPLDLSASRNLPSLLPFILGLQEFTTGRHYWEVTVHGEDDWAVGVARRSVREKRWSGVTFKPTEGIWAISKREGKYVMLSLSELDRVPLDEALTRIRVSLNCEGKQVSFANVDSGIPLAKFQSASFLGEPLCPFFWARGETQLSLCI